MEVIAFLHHIDKYFMIVTVPCIHIVIYGKVTNAWFICRDHKK